MRGTFAFALATVVFSSIYGMAAGMPIREAPPEPDIAAMMETKVSLELANEPWENVVDILRGLPVPPIRMTDPKLKGKRISAKVVDQPLRTALNMICLSSNPRAAWVLEEERWITIRSRRAFGNERITRTYPLGNLAKSPEEAQLLAGAIDGVIANEWGTIAHENTLELTGSRDVQRTVSALLEALAKVGPEGARASRVASASDINPQLSGWPRTISPEFEEKLATPVSFDFIDTPLEDVLHFLGRLLDMVIVLDPKDLAAQDSPEVTIKVSDMTAKESINWVCKMFDLRYTQVDDVLFITSDARALGGRGYLVVHDLSGMFDRHEDAESFVDAVYMAAQLYSRDGQAGAWPAPGRRLIVRGDEKQHRTVAALFDGTRRLEKNGFLECSISPEGGHAHALGFVLTEPDLDAVRRIGEKLQEPVSFDFIDTPIEDIVHFLRQLTGLTIVLDPKALAALHVTEITLKVTDMRLGDALSWIVKAVGLQYSIRDNALLISDENADEFQPMSIAIADVSDLCDFDGEFIDGVKESNRDMWRLREIITKVMEIDHIDNCDCLELRYGAFIQPTSDDKLVIRADKARMDFIRALLDGLRAATPGSHTQLPVTPDGSSATPLGMGAEAGQPDWKREIERKLDERVSFDFIDTPLEDVIHFLRQLTDLTIVLDPKAMEKLEVTEVTLKVTDMPMRDALRWIITLVSLHACLCDNAIFISSPGCVEDMPFKPVCVYWPLVAADVSIPALAREIKEQTDCWFVASFNGKLIIRSTEIQHRQQHEPQPGPLRQGRIIINH